MRTKRFACAIGCLVLAATPARAFMVAGWDFSQYYGPGLLSIDGQTYTTTLDANYSNFDESLGLGPDSGEFGTLYYNGQFGSTAIVPDGTGTEPMTPVEGSLTANLEAPGDPPFDSFDLLISEGQQFVNPLGVVARINSAVSLVFVADLTSVPETGSNWSVSFAGKTLADSSPVGIAFSTDGTNYDEVSTVDLTTSEARYEVSLGPDASELGFVRVTFAPGSGEVFPIIDNVAIFVPEPGAGVAGIGALAALAVVARRRQACSA